MACLINTDNLWLDSLTTDFLTVYAEGLVCNIFDKRKVYKVRRHNKHTWCVLKKVSGEEGGPNSTNQHFLIEYIQLLFIMVNISCRCGHVQRYLIPCRHVCAVIGKKEYYEPSMFHIRWHKLYHYYHSNKYETSTTKHIVDVLRYLLKVTRENYYDDASKSKGMYTPSTIFPRGMANQ